MALGAARRRITLNFCFDDTCSGSASECQLWPNPDERPAQAIGPIRNQRTCRAEQDTRAARPEKPFDLRYLVNEVSKMVGGIGVDL
jgi:hypothetical protein